WSYVGKTDEMAFTITTKHTTTWTGIGFSDDHKMSQTDAILGWVDNSGRPFLMDTWIGGYTSPLLDISQDVTNASGSTVDGITTLLLHSLFVPISPFLCLTVPLSPFHCLTVPLSLFPRDDDNVIARMSLELDEGNYERGRALLPMVSPEEVLNSTVTAGRVGALTLDPAYLVFEPVQVTSTLSDESKEGGAGIFVSATKLYIDHNMVPHSAWKDYSTSTTNISANTNYGYEPYEEKNHHSLNGAN
ncbi:uncharacterized protein LOC103521550, partial [Diaphorina citri]|uniref:Uncharacterized protein LOC103521550 n=1 Tax=Diaphorina citri TaxID=121845 RepID=A0A3Q0JHU4_DIACI